jgi:tetratricopeptide (TPR) repeat protein
MSPPTELFKMKGLAVEDSVRLLRDILQRNKGSSADSEPWLPDDFEDKAEGLAQRFCELPGVIFLVGQQIREQHLTIQVALESNGSANEVLWGMVSRLEDDLNKRPKEMALNTLLLFVLAHLNTHCDIVDIFVSAAHTLRKHPNQELEIPPENTIPYLDDGLEPDKMGSRIQLALSELQGRHFLNLRKDNKYSEMEESTSGSIRDLLGSREQTSRYWLTAARLLALGRLGSKQSIAHLTMARHVDKLLSFQPRVVQLLDVQLFLGPTPDHAQFPTAAAECFADVFFECGFLQRALDLRGFIRVKSRQSDSKRWQYLACTALASAYAAVENWPKAIKLCQEAFRMGGDDLNTMSALADEAEYHGRYGQIKEARGILGQLNQDLEKAWEDTRNRAVLRLWLRVARLNANILTVNASDCKEGRRLLGVVLEIHQDIMKLPKDDRDLLSAKSDLAHACLRDGAPEDALKLYEILLKVFQRSSAYRLDVLSSYERMSECYSKLQKNKQALDYQTAAYHLLRKIDNDDGSVPKRRLEETLCNLATTYHRYGELRKARRAYSDVYDSQESRKASGADLSKSWHALLVLRIDTMRASKEPLPGDVWVIIASDMAWLTKLVGAACRENETSKLQRYTARISLEETKIKYVDLEMSRRDKAWWPEHYERPLGMAVGAAEELGRIYPDVKQEFGETGALTLRCALAFGHGHTLCACIKDNLKPGLVRDSRYEDVKTARVWLYYLKRRLDDSGISREHREATRYLAKLERSFGAEEDMCGQDKMDEGLKPFMLWLLGLLGLVCAVLYCYYYQ